MEKKLLSITRFIISSGFYLLLFFTPLLVTPWTFELFEFPKMIFVYFLTTIIAAAFALKSVVLGRLHFRRTPLDFPIILLAASYLLSTIFSLDKYTSIFGYYTRFNGGLLSLFCYITLFYIFIAEAKDKKFVSYNLRLLLSSSFFVALYGILQHLGIDREYWVQDSKARVFSTLGQPNWLAAYLLMVIPVAFGLMLQQKTKILYTIYYILFTISYAAFWFTYSLSGLLGFLAMAAAFVTLSPKTLFSKNLKVLTLLLAILLLITFARPGLFKSRFWGAAKSIREKISFVALAQEQSSPDTYYPDTAAIRAIVWKGALKLIISNPKTFLIGGGPETFAYCFLPFRPPELNLTSEWDFLYNKAHNWFLDLWATVGLLGLLSYLFLIVKVVKTTKRELLSVALLSGWIGLLLTNFFGWPTVATNLLFWLYPAMMVTDHQAPSPKPQALRISLQSWQKKGAIFAIPLLTSYLLLHTSNFFLADISYARGQSFELLGNLKKASGSLSEAVRLNPREPAYRRELASVYTQRAGEEKDFLRKAEKEAEVAYSLNPKNSLTLKSLIQTYYKMGKLEESYLGRAREITEEALALSPTEAKLYYTSALLYAHEENWEKALMEVQEALELKPNYKEAEELLEILVSKVLNLKFVTRINTN